MRVYLESCPYSEKDAAKKEGAKWDFNAKKWYVPESLLHQVEHFNQWKPNGKMYLNCPYGDKDQAKQLGAKWDGSCKKWYFVPTKSRTEDQFKKWLPGLRPAPESSSNTCDDPSHVALSSSPCSASVAASPSLKQAKSGKSKSKSKSSATTEKKSKIKPKPQTSSSISTPSKVGASRASLPRINPDMTIVELQAECRARDPSIRGLSGKNKQWLLNHLDVGSVWISAPEQGQGQADSSPFATVVAKKSEHRGDISGAKKKKRKGDDETRKATKIVDKPAVKRAKMETGGISVSHRGTSSFASLPRVTPSMTLAQLSHELHHRDPSIKGTSNKNKQWFLSRLGVGSVWMSSTDASDIDFSSTPRVSSFMTISQMSHEILERDPASRGHSGKNKSWFLEQLGVGSIWVTGLEKDRVAAAGTKASLEKVARVGTTTNDRGEESNKKTDDNGVSAIHTMQARMKTETLRIKEKKKNKCASTAATASIPVPDRKKKVKLEPASQVKPDDAVSTEKKIKTEKGRNQEKKNNNCSSAAAATSVPVSNRKKKVKLEPASRVKPDGVASSSTIGSLKAEMDRKDNFVPDDVSSSSTDFNSSLLPNNAAIHQPKSKKKTVTTTTASKTPGISRRGVPLVTKSLTITQLKEECKVRDTGIKGLSNKNKAWLLEYLVEESELEGSREWQAIAQEESRKKHAHKSKCHVHSLADSRKLGQPKIFGTRSKKCRAANAICDIEHRHICVRRASWTCEQCDFDICQACYEIECLSKEEKNRVLKEKYDAIRREQEESLRRYQQEEREREERWKRYEEERERKRQRATRHIPEKIRNPSARHLNPRSKLKYTVWTSCGYDYDGWHSYEGPPDKVFDSSYDSLDDANERVKYVFYYKNPWGSNREEMHADTHVMKPSGMRFICCRPDDSERWTVSVIPSVAFDHIDDDDCHGKVSAIDWAAEEEEKKDTKNIPNDIKEPSARHRDQLRKLKYTVWTSTGADYGYDGPPTKEFDSSFDSLDEANQRVKYVFYYKNPWGFQIDEMYSETNTVKPSGIRLISCKPDDCGSWTVSVIPSVAFDYANDVNDSHGKAISSDEEMPSDDGENDDDEEDNVIGHFIGF